MIIRNTNESSDDFEQESQVDGSSVSGSGSTSVDFNNDTQNNFLRRTNLKRKDYLSGEVPVMHQRGAFVSFVSELLEMFGIRNYDSEYDIDDTSLNLEASEEEQDEDVSSYCDETNTCDLQRNYPLLKDVGKGGQGNVVAAEDLQFGRRVAIKSLKTPDNPKSRQAFFTEARITAHLEHPAIVPIHNIYVDQENAPHMAMKYVEGRSYRERIMHIKKKYAPLSWYKICAVERWQMKLRIERFLRVCDAIEYAHNRNVLHRDLKPENIMVGRFGEVYVMDWGMAIPIPKDQEWVITSVAGTIRYIAPEVLQHRPYGKTADIYQLGLILYETTFLRRAFPWRNRELVIERVKSGELSPMAHYFGCYVPITLKRIIQRATALDPLDRYQSVHELSRDLRGYLKNEATSVERFPRWAQFKRMLSRNSLLLLALLFMACGVAASAVMFNLKHAVDQKMDTTHEDEALQRLEAANKRTGIMLEREIVAVEDDLMELCREASARLQRLQPPNDSYLYFRGTEGFGEEPPGYGYQSTFNKLASFRAFSWHLPVTSEPPDNLDSVLSTLYPMLPNFQGLLTNHFRIEQQNGKRYPVADLSEERTPVLTAAMGFRNELLFTYPFAGHRASDYRVTQQIWYRCAIEDFVNRPVWSGPFPDSSVKDRILLDCSMPIFNSQEERIGAAVVMLEPASLLKLYAQKLSNQPEVRAHYLIHFSGRIYVTDLPELQPTVIDDEIHFHQFPNPELQVRMWELRTGQLFLDDNREVLYIFTRIEPLKCIYVEEIDFAHAVQLEKGKWISTLEHPNEKKPTTQK